MRRSASSAGDDATRPRRAPSGGCSRRLLSEYATSSSVCRELPSSQLRSSRDLLDQTGAIGRREQDRLGVPAPKGAGLIAVGGRRVLFEHGVGIDSGEAERIDARPARRRLVGMNPGAGDRIQSERARGDRRAAGVRLSACKVGGKTR